MGPDNIHPHMLKSLADTISKPLAIIFNKSMVSGTTPEQWAEAIITAIHKKGVRNIVDNYRPISLTSVISKVIESVVRDHIVQHMMENHLFADEQHGFVPMRNCVTQLLESMEAWSQIIEEGGCIDIIYTDFSKAFDPVPHTRLLKKIESDGIKGDILKWIGSFLSNRKQRVKVEGSMSQWIPVTIGIPQGSVLGPILFVLFINDMPSEIKNTCKLFADDAKIFCNPLKTLLQHDIDKLSQWSEKWQLSFNVKKCKVLHVGHNNPLIPYTMEGRELEQTVFEKDLGVTMDKELKFNKQTSIAVKKANQILGLIKKTMATKNENTIPLLYMTLVRPHLEYANAIRGPFYKQDPQLVEKVQRRATKMIPCLSNLSYENRIRSLNMPSLHHRRKRGDMITTYKIMTKRYRGQKEKLFHIRHCTTRGHPFKIYKQHAKSFTRRSSLSCRIVNDWNALLNHIVNANNVNSFKTA